MWHIRKLGEVTSTNTLARELLAEGAVTHGDVLQAAHQTAGRGRLAGRVWNDEPNQSLLMSVVLQQIPPVRIELLQYLIVLAVARALRRFVAERDIQVKWPNDLLLKGRKVCGILSEGVWQAEGLKGLIVGIGVNVAQRAFAPDVAASATSLALEGATVSIDGLRDAILESLGEGLEEATRTPAEQWTHEIINALQREFEWMQQLPPFDVELDGQLELHDMTFAGLSDNGFLLLRHTDGTTRTVNAGSLRLRLPQL